MDRRTVFFVIVISISFFAVNMYFSHKKDQERREELLKESPIEIQEKAELAVEIKEKTAPLSTLPIASIYATKDSQDPIFQGLNINGALLTLSWTKPLPQKVFVDSQEASLANPDTIVEGPVVYTTPQFKYLDTTSLPKTGTHDVQLVSFPQGGPKVYFAKYKNGSLQILQKPETDAIVLFKTDVGYLPSGYYEKASNLYVDLIDLPLFSKIAKAHEPKDFFHGEQKYFVLENDYQQIVFTNVGGAITEINLPFEGKANQASVVKPIGFDRQILENSPNNDYFPSTPFYTAGSSEIHSKGQLGGYYPLLRRSIKKDKKEIDIPAENYALNLVSEYPELSEQIYEVTEFTKDKIVFTAKSSLRRITKTYTLLPTSQSAPYCFNLEIDVSGITKGFWVTSGVPDVELMSNTSSPQIQYRITRKNKGEVEKVDLPKPKELVTSSTFSPNWIVNSNGYLGIIMDPLTPLSPGYRVASIPGEIVPTRLSLIDPIYEPYKPSKYPGYEVMLPLKNESGKTIFRIYAGPFEESTLKEVDKIFTDPQTGQSPHYLSSKTFYGFFSFISEPFAKMLFVVMKFFHALTHSWAFSIILLTIFLRILLYPLNTWSMKSMKRMQEISPQVQAIQKKYKKEPKKAQMEIMQLYRQEKVNPFMGCFPILIQIPFLIGMFDLLKSSFQLRGAGFIPGWIDNLTAPDVLFRWSKPIFFIGTEFHLLPIILGVVMFLQQKFSSNAPKNVNEMTDQQRQQRAMGTMMAVLFTVMFYNFPSGLNIYWLSSMILGIGQQWITNKYSTQKKEGRKKTLVSARKDLKKS